MAKTEFVTARKGNKTTTFVRSAYEKVWKHKGWTEVKDTSRSTNKAQSPSSTETSKE